MTTTSDQVALNDNAIESIVSDDGLARKSETEQQVPRHRQRTTSP